MDNFTQKNHATGRMWKITAAILVIIAGAVPLYIQVNQWIMRSRTVTQTQIVAGWKASGIEISTHAVQPRENFWKIARQYNVDIDTIIGANPGMKELHAAVGQELRVPNRKGTIHHTEEQENISTIASLYSVPVSSIVVVNDLPPKHILVAGLDLFIPGAKPVKLSQEMAAHCGLRGIFGSPLPGRITSAMGLRTHPIGGFRGKHTGVDLAAAEGTRIAAAAAGTVVQTGEGEYIGKFILLKHKDAFTTLYGHCSEIITEQGRIVKKGQIIARVGSTGRATGPHLHFEIRKNGIPQDPLKYLW